VIPRSLSRSLLAGALIALASPAAAARLPGLGADADQASQALQAGPLARLDGGALAPTDLLGHVVVLNFWATWCAPCRRELPRLQVLDAEMAPKGGRVIAVSIDEDLRNVELFVKRTGLRLPIVVDGPKRLARALDLRAVPVTLVLDRSGHVAWSTTRSDLKGYAALQAETRKLLAERPAAAPVAEGSAR
jgi:thiol-disulfide isomerase/thioredoxin